MKIQLKDQPLFPATEQILILKKLEQENKAASDVVTAEIGTDILSINTHTGAVSLNNVEASLKLAKAKNHQITYIDILGESVSKTTKRNLTFVIRNLKEAYPEFRAEFERLGLREYVSVEARNVAFQQLILEWGDYWELNPD